MLKLSCMCSLDCKKLNVDICHIHSGALYRKGTYVAGVNTSAVDEAGYLYASLCREICDDEQKKGYVSVFSHSEKSEGVYISGLKYELENAQIVNTIPLGVSNEFIGKKATVRVENGTLVIMWQEDICQFIKTLNSH